MVHGGRNSRFGTQFLAQGERCGSDKRLADGGSSVLLRTAGNQKRTNCRGTKASERDHTLNESPVSVSVVAENERVSLDLYCPECKLPVPDPLVCGDCTSVICRRCGTPLERVDELGIG